MSKNVPIQLYEKDTVLKYYADKGAKFCAETLTCKVTRVYRIARKLGIHPTPEQFGRRVSVGHQRPDEHYDVRFSQFENPTSPDVAYLLGYMWADGYVRINKNKAYIFSLLIAAKDYRAIKSSLDRLGRWRVYHFVNAAKTPCVNIQTSNIRLVKWLLEMDYGTKSFDAPKKITSHLPLDLKPYFWRGYFDGDGHFRIRGGVYHFSFTADYTYDWTTHSDLLNSLGIGYKISHRVLKDGRKSDIVCSNMAGTYKFGAYVYVDRENDGIGLDRKYQKWLECKRRFEQIIATNAVRIRQSSIRPLTDDLLLEIIREHSGVINQQTIAKHFGLKGWQVSEMTQRLCKHKKITFVGNTSSVRYIAL